MSIENPDQIAALSLDAKNQALFNACKQGNVVEVETLLLHEGAEPNARDEGNNTPLHFAARMGYTAIVEILINARADVNIQNIVGRTPLHNAAIQSCTAIVEILINARADVNIQDQYNRAPLHIAASNGHTAIATILINAGPNVNIQDQHKRAPIHCAIRGENTAVAEILIKAGASINLLDGCNETPIHLAASKNMPELIVQMLQVHSGVQCNSQLDPYHEALCHHYAWNLIIVASRPQFVHQTLKFDQIMTSCQLKIRAYLEIGKFTKAALHKQVVAPTEEDEDDDTEELEVSTETVYITASHAADAVTDTSDPASTIVVAEAAPLSHTAPPEGSLALDLDELIALGLAGEY